MKLHELKLLENISQNKFGATFFLKKITAVECRMVWPKRNRAAAGWIFVQYLQPAGLAALSRIMSRP